VYTHKKAKAVEYMVVDALTEADVVWNNEISNSIWDVTEFIRLDDSILKRIEWSREPALKKGREIIRRIRNRELYCYGAPPLQVVSLVSLFFVLPSFTTSLTLPFFCGFHPSGLSE
jgi:hypothetical protein